MFLVLATCRLLLQCHYFHLWVHAIEAMTEQKQTETKRARREANERTNVLLEKDYVVFEVEQAHSPVTVTIYACVQNSSLDFLECIHSTQRMNKQELIQEITIA